MMDPLLRKAIKAHLTEHGSMGALDLMMLQEAVASVALDREPEM